MKVLMSPVTTQEAVIAWQCGADIIDINSVSKDSLGASFPWMIQDVISNIPDLNVEFSANLGSLPYKPGTASLAALGAISSGVKYIKAGLYGLEKTQEGIDVMRAVVRTCKDHGQETIVIATSYADYPRFNGLSPNALIDIAVESNSDMVMLDTFFKGGQTLFDALDEQQLDKFVYNAHKSGLKVILAGSIQENHLNLLTAMNVDVVGVRAAVCSSYDRSATIDAEKAKRFIEAANQHY